jgi:predicted Zn-ribbon and HTH transcriptional regulator
MAKRAQPLSFDPSRFQLGSTEEVRVGAYARRQLQRRILLGVFGVLLIAGAFVLYVQLRPHGEATDVERYPVRVRCASCGYSATVHVPFAQTFPMECPACREMACQVLWRCRDCGAEFVLEQTGPLVRCPACRSERIGSAAVP